MRFAQTQVCPEFRYFEAIAPDHGGVQIRVVEDDERRIAAEFERELLQRVRGQRMTSLPISVEPVTEILRTIGLCRAPCRHRTPRTR